MSNKNRILFCKNCLQPFETDYNVEKGFYLSSSPGVARWYKLNEVDIYCMFCTELDESEGSNKPAIHFVVIKEFEKTRIIAFFLIKKDEKRKTKYSDVEGISMVFFKENEEVEKYENSIIL